jgi:hypothetical protein
MNDINKSTLKARLKARIEKIHTHRVDTLSINETFLLSKKDYDYLCNITKNYHITIGEAIRQCIFIVKEELKL